LLEKSLELIHETGVIPHSLTFDGNRVNITMCTNLSANFDVGETVKPYSFNPITKKRKKFSIFWTLSRYKINQECFGR